MIGRLVEFPGSSQKRDGGAGTLPIDGGGEVIALYAANGGGQPWLIVNQIEQVLS
ncbi:MAG: hypothetical protein R3B83_10760 [Nitrospirales bacterium]|nr:hypothetical protein [Nitrospirales bacterium]